MHPGTWETFYNNNELWDDLKKIYKTVIWCSDRSAFECHQSNQRAVFSSPNNPICKWRPKYVDFRSDNQITTGKRDLNEFLNKPKLCLHTPLSRWWGFTSYTLPERSVFIECLVVISPDGILLKMMSKAQVSPLRRTLRTGVLLKFYWLDPSSVMLSQSNRATMAIQFEKPITNLFFFIIPIYALIIV